MIGTLALAISTTRAVATPFQGAMQKGRVAIGDKQFSQAETFTRQALDLAQTPEEKAKALSNLGTFVQASGQKADAQKLWEQVVSLPDAPDEIVATTHFSIGSSYFNQDELK